MPALIAVVDDEQSVRRALERLLVSAGLNVEVYCGGEEFLTALATHRPDCVVLDLHMPGVSGFDVQQQLSVTGDKLPVIAITGHDAPGSEARVRSLGAAAYLHKPVNAKLLLEAIASATGTTV